MTATDDDIRAKTLQVATAYLTLMGDWDAWTDLWAEDGVLEFPYAPKGRQKAYSGRAEIREYMIAASGKMTMAAPPRMRMHPALDPSVLSVELSIDGKATATGKLFTQSYVMVFETNDGRLLRLREYWNPMVNIEAFADGDIELWASRFGKPEVSA